MLWLLMLLLTGPAYNLSEAPRYRVSVDGPLIEIEFTCNDPCTLDRTEVVGHAAPELEFQDGNVPGIRRAAHTGTHIIRERLGFAQGNVQCQGNCQEGGGTSRIRLGVGHRLEEGLEVRIRDSYADFVFATVVYTDDGPATLRHHSEFRIDRPLIELTLEGHKVVVQTRMSEAERQLIQK